jgi:hypothetical protein
MTHLLALSVLFLVSPFAHDGVEALEFAVAVESQTNSDELWGVSHVESRHVNGRRSGPGACCRLGILGDRYGNPSCDYLEGHPWGCVLAAQWNLEYWRRHCGAAYLDAYNGGWYKCWTNKRRETCADPCEEMEDKTERIRCIDERCRGYGFAVRNAERRNKRRRR